MFVAFKLVLSYIQLNADSILVYEHLEWHMLWEGFAWRSSVLAVLMRLNLEFNSQTISVCEFLLFFCVLLKKTLKMQKAIDLLTTVYVHVCFERYQNLGNLKYNQKFLIKNRKC